MVAMRRSGPGKGAAKPLAALAVLLACAPAAGAWEPDVRRAAAWAQTRTGEVRFAVRAGNRTWGHRRAVTAPAASLVKAMLLVAALRRHHGEPVPAAERDLLRPMVRASGNRAATIVRDGLGSGALDRIARRAGLRDFAEQPFWGASTTSPRDQARFFSVLPRLVPRRHRAYALDLLGSIVRRQRWGVGAVAPEGWELYFKGGWGSGRGLVDHQSALLVRGRRRIAVSVMTVGNRDHTDGKATLAGVFRRLLRGL